MRSLPGTTLASVVERGDYDPAQQACLSIAALEEILVLFVSRVTRYQKLRADRRG